MPPADYVHRADGLSPLCNRVRSVRVTLLTENGGRVDWSPSGNALAFDWAGTNGYFDVYVMGADGSHPICLTCSKAGIKASHNGNPAWHPSGEYIVFQSQDPRLFVMPILGKLYTNPGSGINNNLWLMSADGKTFWQLTHVQQGNGVLHAHFSHDGRQLIWSERVSDFVGGRHNTLGQWAIKIADFSLGAGTPAVGNVRTYYPGGLQMYEVHGFSPDDQRILFTGVRDDDFFHADISEWDLAAQTTSCLTCDVAYEWDEHAHYAPDGAHIVWMSRREVPQSKSNSISVVTEYWLMARDGSQKTRLTYFNDPSSPHYGGREMRPAAVAWRPDGQALVGYVIKNRTLEVSPIYLIELVSAPAR